MTNPLTSRADSPRMRLERRRLKGQVVNLRWSAFIAEGASMVRSRDRIDQGRYSRVECARMLAERSA